MGKETAERHRQHIGLGVLFAVLAALSTALVGWMVKLIGAKASVDTILFARYAIGMLLVLPWAAKEAGEVVKISQPMKIVFRSAATLLSTSCFFFALKGLPLGNAVLLMNTFPLFVPLILWHWHKIATSGKMWVGTAIGFAGIALILKPGTHFFDLASWVGLGSGIFSAVAIILIRFMTKALSIVQIIFYNFLIAVIVTGVLLPWIGTKISSDILLHLALVGIFGMAYQVFSTLALAKARARVVSPLMYLAIIFSVAIDFIYWDIVPDILSLAGMAAVIGGGTITTYYSQKETATTPPESGSAKT